MVQIKDILKAVNFGSFFVETALLLRNSIFINGTIYNSKIWYNLKQKEVDELERIDRQMVSTWLETPITTPKEAIFLELGIQPLGSIIKERRINFLHYLCTRKKESMLSKFFRMQWMKPSKGDWTTQVKQDLDDIKLNIELTEMKKIPKNKFKNLVKEKIKELTFSSLLEEKTTHSKMKRLTYNEYKTQSYLKNKNITKEQMMNVFRFRTGMSNFATNFGSKMKCPLCKNHEDSQEELNTWETLKSRFENLDALEDVYKFDVSPESAKLLTDIMKFRDQ